MITEDDYESVRQLFARFGQCLDFADAPGFASCFTQDGIFDSSEPAPELCGVHKGNAGLMAYVAASLPYNEGRVRHSPAQSLIELAGDTGRANSYVLVSRDYGPPKVSGDLTHAELATTGMYYDDLRKVDGTWRIARRVYRHDGLPDVLARFGKPLTLGPL